MRSTEKHNKPQSRLTGKSSSTLLFGNVRIELESADGDDNSLRRENLDVSPANQHLLLRDGRHRPSTLQVHRKQSTRQRRTLGFCNLRIRTRLRLRLTSRGRE